MEERKRILPLLLTCLLWLHEAVAFSEVARSSCVSHFLSGFSSSGVFLLSSPTPSLLPSPVLCQMPSSPDGTVTTVIHSALERSFQIKKSATVGWQVSDWELLSSLNHRSRCHQVIRIEERTTLKHSSPSPLPQAEKEVLVTVVSFSGKRTDIQKGVSVLNLTGEEAGILHVEVSSSTPLYSLPVISSSPFICEEPVVSEEAKGCLLDEGVQIEISPTASSFHASFRTEESEQNLFSALLSPSGRIISVDLQNDFFLSLADSSLLVGLLSNGAWHSLLIAADASHFIIDSLRFNLPPPKDEPEMEEKVTKVLMKLNGVVLLRDPSLQELQCQSSRIFRDGQPLRTRPFCLGSPSSSGCQCFLLPQLFHHLPSPSCAIYEFGGDAYAIQLWRQPDMLSFLLLRDKNSWLDPLQLALSFKSDSDSGLLLFGEWRHGEDSGGRVQVHFHNSRLSAIHCIQRKEEERRERETAAEQCTACAITSTSGYGGDSWRRVVLFELAHQRFLAVDSSVCQLLPFHSQEDSLFDSADMYKTLVSRSAALFIGGMFNKKVKNGIYRDEFKAKFFENTREKLPSLRGCIRDIFVGGERVSPLAIMESQMQETLLDPSSQAFAVRMGCPSCSPGCPPTVRCRSFHPLASVSATHCDCSDIQEYQTATGKCAAVKYPPLSLSASSLSAYRGEFHVERQQGPLAKIWVKMSLPRREVFRHTPLLLFFTHGRRLLLRLFLTPSHRLALQVNPEDPANFTEDVLTHPIDSRDDRVHLIQIERRTPLGTHPSKRFFDVIVDGRRTWMRDPGLPLSAIEFALLDDFDEGESGCIHDIGLGFDYDEQSRIHDPKNRIQQMNVMELMWGQLGPLSSEESLRSCRCGVLDPTLWMDTPLATAPIGLMLPYSPKGSLVRSAPPLSASWLFYSLLLTILLVLFIVLFLFVYLCYSHISKHQTRRRGDSQGDQERMMKGDSPGYGRIPFRKQLTDDESVISDSIDRTDISAYDDIKMRKVKVDRESMISFLESRPDSSRGGEAVLVMVARSPSPNDAPLVNLTDIGQ